MVTINIPQIIDANTARQNWPRTPTGVWGDAKSVQQADANTGYLIIWEQHGRVVGISTTMDSVWEGSFRNRVLSARYVNRHNVAGQVELALSEAGDELAGRWWTTQGGDNGTYSAYRAAQVTKAFLVDHIGRRFAGRVTILA